MMKMNVDFEKIKKDLSQLLEWDCTDVKFTATFYQFTTPDDYFVEAEDIHETLSETISKGNLYGCCEVIVDQDIMMCPKCKEHV